MDSFELNKIIAAILFLKLRRLGLATVTLCGNTSMVGVLLVAGANLHAKEGNGKTALDYAPYANDTVLKVALRHKYQRYESYWKPRFVFAQLRDTQTYTNTKTHTRTQARTHRERQIHVCVEEFECI